MELKLLFSYIGILISLVAFIYYYYSIYKGDTKPHVYTWLIFSLTLWVWFIIQIQNEWWYGSYVTLAEFIWCFVVFLLALKYWEKNITRFDTFCLILAVISLVLYLSFKLAIISTILIIAVEIFAIIPTYRKSYMKPHEETTVIYYLSSLVYIFSILWLSEHSFATYWYPTSIIIADSILVIYLLVRRKILSK